MNTTKVISIDFVSTAILSHKLFDISGSSAISRHSSYVRLASTTVIGKASIPLKRI
ncbi:Uncharacterised protein [Yersinia intermedia]|uniref:hypothetical protein n=1 Tax=Yersinia intermedia TaxID=631 RepID=UPI0005DF18B5|nr:hypothetical protein [Yersinia intermedia]UZM70589.1 hypothetical protein OP861_19010 [Yersinia intermedia]CNB77201.1 Uncharacterised protein [Yersinia intermedia]CNH22513.1 Uncharacterised protein [Yersinia intermedia]